MECFRAYTAAVAIGDQVMVAAGYTGAEFLDSFEVFTSGDAWDSNYPPVPTTAYQHCMVQLDEENLILIGGIQARKHRKKSIFYRCRSNSQTLTDVFSIVCGGCSHHTGHKMSLKIYQGQKPSFASKQI